MRVLEVNDYPYNRIEIEWHGPYPWQKSMTCFKASTPVMKSPGIYRAESAGQDRKIIKYIGSASDCFAKRLNVNHRIKHELVNGAFRKIDIFLGVLKPEREIQLTRRHIVEIEYILQNVHYQDLISWHGISKLPKTSRGEGWHIVNKGARGQLHRVIVYPAFAVSGHDQQRF
jgi:hypothetical protein